MEVFKSTYHAASKRIQEMEQAYCTTEKIVQERKIQVQDLQEELSANKKKLKE